LPAEIWPKSGLQAHRPQRHCTLTSPSALSLAGSGLPSQDVDQRSRDSPGERVGPNRRSRPAWRMGCTRCWPALAAHVSNTALSRPWLGHARVSLAGPPGHTCEAFTAKSPSISLWLRRRCLSFIDRPLTPLGRLLAGVHVSGQSIRSHASHFRSVVRNITTRERNSK
jgi:hypothetical protein